jgi:glycosyltransferase involved in cell wall biosynthesis
MEEKIQIVILSRDRPGFLRQTIDSVLNQKILFGAVEIIISDNSNKDDVSEMESFSLSYETFSISDF